MKLTRVPMLKQVEYTNTTWYRWAVLNTWIQVNMIAAVFLKRGLLRRIGR